ncbi:hypothetical protein K438DRAFT_587928 [Mycena galopus ATCC 62051]|nr:hypothetical protein K438DRAFT_587928 [Mycena galopus ATCC 62051]
MPGRVRQTSVLQMYLAMCVSVLLLMHFRLLRPRVCCRLPKICWDSSLCWSILSNFRHRFHCILFFPCQISAISLSSNSRFGNLRLLCIIFALIDVLFSIEPVHLAK